MADGKRRYKSDRKDYKVSVKLSEKDMDILKAAPKRTGMTASAYIKTIGRTISSLLQINIVMNWGLLSCRQSTAGIRKISAGTSGKEKCQ